jgi:hypothetical protein
VLLLVIGGLIGSATFAGRTVGLGMPRTAATAFLPADGTAAYQRVETSARPGPQSDTRSPSRPCSAA